MACEYDQHTSEYNSECDSFPWCLPWRTCNTVLFLQLCVLIGTQQVCLSLEVCRYISIRHVSIDERCAKYIKGFKFATEYAKVVKYAIEYAKRSSMGHSWNGGHQLFESWSVPNLWMLTTSIWWGTWCPEVLATAGLCNMSSGLVGTEHGTWKTKIE